MNDALKRMIPRWFIKRALPQVMRREARRHGLSMKIRSGHIDLVKGSTVLRVSCDHAVYLTDTMVSFDYYATAVVPLTVDGRNIIDFSTPRYHDVVGFEAPRIIVEPHVLAGVETTAACISALEGHGYTCEKIVQHGVPLPLIQCVPARHSTRSAHS